MLLPACRRREAPPALIALVPLENLSGSGEADWLSAALVQVARYELAGATTARVIVAPTAEDALAAGAGAIVSGYYVTRGGTVQIHSFIETPARRRVRPAVDASFSRQALVSAATAIARSVSSGRLRAFPETPEAALASWSAAGARQDRRQRAELLEKAIHADPNFTPAWVALLRLKSVAGDRAAVNELATRAGQMKLDAAGAAEIRFLAALAAGDTADIDRAVTAVIQHSGGSTDTLIEYGLLAFRNHLFVPAARLYRQAVRLDPRDLTIWNQLVYAEAFSGNKAAAEQALAAWAAADPSNPNVDDSAGDIEFYFGWFDAAEKAYLRANRKNPSFLGGAPLLKAARARLMTGDVGGADTILNRYVALRGAARDPRIGLVEAQWLYLSGRHREALRALEALYGEPPVAAVAHAQAALWAIDAGALGQARAQAQQALADARNDASARFIAALAAFLCQPPATAAGWQQRAGASFPGPQSAGVRQTALAYALLLGRQPREAVPVLRALLRTQDPVRGGAERVLLAAALVESGATAEAAPLLERFPIPPGDGISVFAWMHFPRLFELRAKAFGGSEEGRRSLTIYRQLSP